MLLASGLWLAWPWIMPLVGSPLPSRDDADLVVLELSDVLARSQRRGDRSTDQIAGMHLMLSEFAKERLGLLEPRSPDFERACEWVKDSRSPALRGADALHLAIAQSHNLELFTADQALAQAAQARGIPCLVL